MRKTLKTGLDAPYAMCSPASEKQNPLCGPRNLPHIATSALQCGSPALPWLQIFSSEVLWQQTQIQNEATKNKKAKP
ncbi:hypothetical protein GOBAR_DD20911 [Gossypium barbadense]|nr:hypothetical protein GOBAR_DD20911 [Gossypium barbadense]